jgi:replicative DNA helicase
MPEKTKSSQTPPQDLQAESAVLGAILIDPEAIVKASEILRPDSFYAPKHQTIFACMQSLYEKREPIDVVTLSSELKKSKQLESVGGASGLADLSTSVTTSAHLTAYAQVVANAYIKRQLISMSAEISSAALDDGQPASDILDLAEQKVFAASQQNNRQAFLPIKDTLAESFERLDELQRNGGELRGLPTGFADLDKLLAGMQKSNLLILAARPGMGKTAFALNIAQYAAVAAHKKVGVFSLEMSREELVDRLLVGQADIDAWRLKTGRLDQQDFLRLSEAMGVLADAQIFIDDSPGLSIYDMRTKARRLMSEHHIDLLLVDYLQLAQGRTRDNRVQEVGEISQGLKNIARELKIPVLALSQLSRAIESRGEKLPQLSDLRESGCLAGETLIHLPLTGERVMIKDLVNRAKTTVSSVNQGTWKIEPAECIKAFSTGKKPVFRLTTKLGRSIRATVNHKFLTFSGWKRLDELVVGEVIATPRYLQGKGKEKLSEDQLALLGHLIGDGCTLARHAIQYTTREKDLAEKVKDLATKVFGNSLEPVIKKERSWYQVYLSSSRKLTHGVRNPVAVWLDSLKTFDLRSYEKFIPVLVFQQDMGSTAVFLRHLWSTDGCIRLKNGYPAVYYASSSFELAEGVSTLLLKLGILSRVKRVDQGNKGRDQYHVIVSGNEDLTLFCQKVKAVGEYKMAGLELIVKYLGARKGNTNKDIIPSQVWQQHILPVMKSLKITGRSLQAQMGMAYCGTSLYRQNLSRERLQKIATIISSTAANNLATSDIYWDKIASIVPDGETEVFDLTVPPHSNFVANNIVVHNSIEQDADVVMFLYRKDDDNRESVNLKIAKHRNGALGDIDLFFRGDRIKFYGMETRR